MQVEEVKCQGQDAAGVDILEVYIKQPPHYAVYRTKERVLVHFADGREEAKQQSSILAPLNPTRGEIYGLLDGWRESKKPNVQARMGRYRRRIADALGAGLENDAPGALALLTQVKADIVGERTSWARFLYLISASLVALSIIVLVAVVCWWWPDMGNQAWALWFSLTGGTIGAFFSIAIGIRNRTVLTDLHWIDNSADAVLRVVIGAIAAAVMITFVQLGAFKLTIGDLTLGSPAAGTSAGPVAAGDLTLGSPAAGTPAGPVAALPWLGILLMAFVAGFSERLIPDLLAKSVPATAPPTTPVSAPAAAPAALTQPQVASTAEPDSVQEQKQAEDQYQFQDCLCDHGVDPSEETPDSELPPATGGIAAPRVPVVAGQS